MKLVILLCLVALAVAAPPPRLAYNPDDVQILSYENDNTGLGSYRYAYEQTDGQKQEQHGELRNAGLDNEYIAIKGSYTYIGPDGVKYTITYVADENGYQPEIEDAPGSVIPPAVVASLLG